MSEPTAEQVNAETQAAKRLVKSILRDLEDRRGVGNELEAIDKDTRKELEDTLGGIAATVLARVRIEAHAAGRDDGLEAAADVAEGYDGDGREPDPGTANEIAYDIRALRGRT